MLRRIVHLEQARARFGDRVDRLIPFLSNCDPLADAVLVAMEAVPSGLGWKMIEQALAHGVARVEGAPAALRDFCDVVEQPPAWVDWPTLDRGGAVLLRAGPIGGLVLGAKALVYGYASPGGNKPLVFSGRLREAAPTRLNETARFVQAVCRPGGLRTFGDGYQITLKVRLIHARIRHMILKSGRWDASAWGAPINQHDMAATTLLFSLVVLEGLRQLGVRVPADNGDDYMQLWRYAGHLIGVDPQLQPTSEADGGRLAEVIAATQGPPDEDSRALVRALMEAPAMQAVSPAERALARRRVHFGYAICRELVGDSIADALGVERTSWWLAVQALKRVVRATDRVRASVAAADRQALIAGSRYWDRVVKTGLHGATAEFRLPHRLAA